MFLPQDTVNALSDLLGFFYNLFQFKIPLIECFPLGNHVESIALLQKSNRKSKPDSYVKLSLDMEDYYRIKDAEGSTEIE